MNIEAGKYYRMRSGGAVRIETETDLGYRVDGIGTWFKGGSFSVVMQSPLDLVAEITESEYNRIVAGEAYTSAVLDTAETALGKMSDEIATLKAENARLTGEVNRLSENTAFDRISERVRQDERRFDAAKSAMMGIRANDRSFGMDAEDVAVRAVELADALLKALGETK
jgi:hypothetical protein